MYFRNSISSHCRWRNTPADDRPARLYYCPHSRRDDLTIRTIRLFSIKILRTLCSKALPVNPSKHSMPMDKRHAGATIPTPVHSYQCFCSSVRRIIDRDAGCRRIERSLTAHPVEHMTVFAAPHDRLRCVTWPSSLRWKSNVSPSLVTSQVSPHTSPALTHPLFWTHRRPARVWSAHGARSESFYAPFTRVVAGAIALQLAHVMTHSVLNGGCQTSIVERHHNRALFAIGILLHFIFLTSPFSTGNRTEHAVINFDNDVWDLAVLQ